MSLALPILAETMALGARRLRRKQPAVFVWMRVKAPDGGPAAVLVMRRDQ